MKRRGKPLFHFVTRANEEALCPSRQGSARGGGLDIQGPRGDGGAFHGGRSISKAAAHRRDACSRIRGHPARQAVFEALFAGGIEPAGRLGLCVHRSMWRRRPRTHTFVLRERKVKPRGVTPLALREATRDRRKRPGPRGYREARRVHSEDITESSQKLNKQGGPSSSSKKLRARTQFPHVQEKVAGMPEGPIHAATRVEYSMAWITFARGPFSQPKKLPKTATKHNDEQGFETGANQKMMIF